MVKVMLHSARTNVLWLLLACLIVLSALATEGTAEDLRARRETLSIETFGERNDGTVKLVNSLQEDLDGRFQILPSGGECRLTLSGSRKGGITKGEAGAGEVVYYVRFKGTDGETYTLFSELSDASGLGNKSSMIMRKLNEVYPLASRVISVQGDIVYVDMGSNVGLRPGNRLKVIDFDGSQAGIIKLESVSDMESQGHVISGGGIFPGQEVSPQAPLRGGIGIEYTHFAVDAGSRNLTGRDVVAQFRYDPPSTAPFGIVLSSGYIDFVQEKGWHVLNLDVIATLELKADFLSLEIGAGGGLSLTEFKAEKNDSGQVVTPSAKASGMYDSFAGLRFLFGRTIAMSLRAGYMGYSRYRTPNQPVIRVAIAYLGT